MSERVERRHIVAMGGGGFLMEPGNPLLDDYVLSLVGKPRPRVCFLPTASGDADSYLLRFYAAFAERAVPSHLSLFNRSVTDLRALLCAQDVIYVGGGNTLNMLAIWRAHGLDTALRDAWQAGVVLCGVSAGAVCWFEAGVTDSYGRPLRPLARGLGLGFLAGSMCPHYDGEADRRTSFHRFVAGGLPDGLAADDGAALHFVGDTLAHVVTSRPDVGAYRVVCGAGGIVETPLAVRYLG